MGRKPAPLVGVDLAEPGRLADRMARTPTLEEELFHSGEVAYARTQTAPNECLAARFAAKEAVAKALGLDGFDPLDVEVTGGGENCGVRLHGAAADRAAELGVGVAISLSHLPGLAIAVAVAQPAAPPTADPDDPFVASPAARPATP